MNGRRGNTFPIDKKTRDLIKRKNTLSKKVASSSDQCNESGCQQNEKEV
jgi:hypothetical protein